MKNLRLSFIILDVVAIIAILGVILLADLSEQRQITKMQGGQTYKIENVIQSYPDRDNPCAKLRCPNTDPAVQIGWDAKTDIAICNCPDGELIYVDRV